MYRRLRPYFICFFILLGSLLLSVSAGTVKIPLADLIKMLSSGLLFRGTTYTAPQIFGTILFQIRIPHSLLITLTGAALAGSGAAYQGVFRNPLADPYLIGVASGAGLGAVAAMSIQWPSNLRTLFLIPVAAFIGALLTVLAVYALSRIGSSLPTTTMILAGVAVSSFATALTSFLMLRSTQELRRAIGWLLGGSILNGWEPVIVILPYLALGLSILISAGHTINVLQFGDEQAMQLGLKVESFKIIIILAASLTTAAAVAFSGIIGFIGLIVPHLIRLLWGNDYRRLIPLSILSGGSALLVADLVARTLLSPQIIPVGIVTSLIGAPFFLWVLRRTRKQSTW